MNSLWSRRLRMLAFAPLVAVSSALAYPPTYGTEFNFMSKKIDQADKLRPKGVEVGPEEHELAKAMADEVVARCPKCKLEEHKGKWGTEYRFTVPDGSWSFNIAVDPSTVEVQTTPATAAQVRTQVSEMKDYIYASAEAVGLKAYYVKDVDGLSAHLNVGARSAFDGDPRGFMRFLVEYQNRAPLCNGALGDDFANAPHISELKPEQRAAFARLVDDVNAGRVTTIDEIARRMNQEVYVWTPTYNVHGLSSGNHYQSIGLKQLSKTDFLTKDMPFELRAIRMPSTPEDYALLTELMDAHIDHVKKLGNAPIRFVDSTKAEIDFYRATPEVQALEFHLFTEDLGLSTKKFRSLVSADVRKVLDSGLVARVLDGNAKFTSETELALLDYLAKSALSSHASETKLYAILSKQKDPSRTFATILDRIYYDAELNTEAAHVVLERTKKMITQAAAHGVHLDVSPEVYIKGLEELARPVGFVTKCARWLKNPFGWW